MDRFLCLSSRSQVEMSEGRNTYGKMPYTLRFDSVKNLFNTLSVPFHWQDYLIRFNLISILRVEYLGNTISRCTNCYHIKKT